MTMWQPRMEGRPGPRYRAIAEAIAEDAARGRLRPGSQLPTHRDLADRLGVTVGTVTRAYAEAARRGIVTGEVGRGTFVRGTGAESPGFRFASQAEAGLIDMSVNLPPAPPDPGGPRPGPHHDRGLCRARHPPRLRARGRLAGASGRGCLVDRPLRSRGDARPRARFERKPARHDGGSLRAPAARATSSSRRP